MIVTDDAEWAARAAAAARARHERQRRRPARERAAWCSRQYLETGFNYRMTDIQAAVGLVQLGRLDGMVGQRRELAARYHELLADVPGVATGTRPGLRHHQLPVVLGAARPRSAAVTPQRRAGRARGRGHLGPARHHGRPPRAGVRRTSATGRCRSPSG